VTHIEKYSGNGRGTTVRSDFRFAQGCKKRLARFGIDLLGLAICVCSSPLLDKTCTSKWSESGSNSKRVSENDDVRILDNIYISFHINYYAKVLTLIGGLRTQSRACRFLRP
jgi:hypothetical protein